MEKVIITGFEDSLKTYNEKNIIKVTLKDGRTCSFFTKNPTELEEHLLKEIEVEIKENGEYGGAKQYILNLPKTNNNNNKKFTPRDYTFEKKKVALECATQFISSRPQLNSNEVLLLADKFYSFLNK